MSHCSKIIWSFILWIEIFLYTYGLLYNNIELKQGAAVALCISCFILLLMLLYKLYSGSSEDKPIINFKHIIGYLIIGLTTSIILTSLAYNKNDTEQHTIYIFALIIAITAIIVACILGNKYPKDETFYFWSIITMLTANCIGFMAVLSNYDAVAVLITIIIVDVLIQIVFSTYACKMLNDKGFWFTIINVLFIILISFKCLHLSTDWFENKHWKITVWIIEGLLCFSYFVFLDPCKCTDNKYEQYTNP